MIDQEQQKVIDWLDSPEGQQWSELRACRLPGNSALANQGGRIGIFADLVDDHPDAECHCRLIDRKVHRWRPIGKMSPMVVKSLERLTGTKLDDDTYL